MSFENIFHPVEHAILSDWLRRPRPECARYIELVNYQEAPERDDYDDDVPERYESNFIRLRAPQFDGGDGAYNELDNAVARLCLQAIQHRLPQWGAVRADGEVILARSYEPALERAVNPLPQHILEINWATNGPGYSWPESYHVIFLPFYDVFVVTASQDSPEVHGYVDEAIAWFSAEHNRAERVEHVLKKYWAERHDEWGQERWECVFAPGLVSAETAHQWADEIWEPEEQIGYDDNQQA